MLLFSVCVCVLMHKKICVFNVMSTEGNLSYQLPISAHKRNRILANRMFLGLCVGEELILFSVKN